MPVIENLMVANHAEAINGLLYVSGGGWTEHWRGPVSAEGQFPPSHLGIGLTMLTPWLEANRRFQVRILVEPEDGGDPIVSVEGEMESGRPAGLPEGSDLRTAVALNAEVAYPQAGGYRLVAQVGDDRRSVSFRVHDQLPPGVQTPPAAAPM
jgi:Family of unknown function (DUF6941)